MLIDDVKIQVKAGDGGSGSVAFNKTKMNLGPTGARGGDGGNIIFQGIENIGALRKFRHQKNFTAENGHQGGHDLRDGRAGKDLILQVPVGTVIHNLTSGKISEIKKIGQTEIIARGGIGGLGNYFFRSSTNTSPKNFQSGKPGEDFELRLELKLIADIGFVGLPNAGKSTLLNLLTNAQSRVANYPFTTLEPSLGAYYELILADIPGIIEGASTGRGLGVKFLRHIERTQMLFHFISVEEPDPVKTYRVIRSELEAFNPALLKKKELIFLSKIDLVSEKELKSKLNQLKKINLDPLLISKEKPETILQIKTLLNEIKKEKFQ